MEKFTLLRAIAAPLMRQNVDTDILIRIERLIGLDRNALGPFCFEVWRYDAEGRENPDFLLNAPQYRESKILLAGANFGCGSSREGAVWALMGMGMRCVIAPSFGDIFYNNCFQNGMLPVVLPMPVVQSIADQVASDPTGKLVSVDLATCTVTAPDGEHHAFAIDVMRQKALLEGLDEIGQLLLRECEIAAFQAHDKQQRPWVYLGR